MMNTLVMDSLVGYFNAEISNKVQEKNGELIVEFADGKKAKIQFINLV